MHHPITDHAKQSYPMEEQTTVRQAASHFKPLTTRWAPMVPSSVCDWTHFMHWRAA